LYVCCTVEYSRSEFAKLIFFERFISMSHNQNYLATTVAIYRSDIDYSKEIKSPCLKVRESP
jgi:hypothetical protein